MYLFTAGRLAPRAIARPLTAARPLHQSAFLSARKDAQDKDSMVVDSDEVSKSGSDSAAAATEDAAFSPDKTRPEEEHDAAGKESGSKDMNNPLNVSPANPEVSKPRDPQEGGAEGSPSETGKGSERPSTSGGGSAPKGSKSKAAKQ